MSTKLPPYSAPDVEDKDEKDDPLDILFVKNNLTPQDKDVILEMVRPYARIMIKTGTVLFLGTADELFPHELVYVYMLAFTAWSDKHGISPVMSLKDIELGTHLDEGQVRRALGRLVKDKLVKINTARVYGYQVLVPIKPLSP